MKRVRTIVFWCHLTAGVLAGAVILIMSMTGAVLAFQPQILNWLERDVRTSVPSGSRLSADAIVAAAAVSRHAAPVSASFDSDPRVAVSVSFGRGGVVWVDPYTGRVRGEGATAARAFFQIVTEWHRWLAREGASRQTARSITGASNVVFLLLGLSGLYLWIPRSWSWRNVRAVIWFQRTGTGRARDFNWHNVIGLWCVPAIIIMAATAVVMSYPWANRIVYQLAGTPLPAQQQRPAGGAPEGAPLGAAGERGRAGRDGDAEQAVAPAPVDRAIARAAEQLPAWRSLTIRFAQRPDGPQVVTLTDGAYWNAFARSTLTVDGVGATRWEPYSAQSRGQKWRGWIRFAHTGELGGVVGQAVAGIGCLGGVFLVYTGLSLAVRRLWRSRAAARLAPVVPALVPAGRSVVQSAPIKE